MTLSCCTSHSPCKRLVTSISANHGKKKKKIISYFLIFMLPLVSRLYLFIYLFCQTVGSFRFSHFAWCKRKGDKSKQNKYIKLMSFGYVFWNYCSYTNLIMWEVPSIWSKVGKTKAKKKTSKKKKVEVERRYPCVVMWRWSDSSGLQLQWNWISRFSTMKLGSYVSSHPSPFQGFYLLR